VTGTRDDLAMCRRFAAFAAEARKPLRHVLDRLVAAPWLPFEVRSRLRWRQEQGTWIAHRPDAFTEKVRWKMLKDRRQLTVTFADRVAVRDYVAAVAGTDCLSDCYAVVSDAADLASTSLPRQFAAKSSHGSGGMWMVTDGAPAEGWVIPGEGPVPAPPAVPSGWCWVRVQPDRLDREQLAACFHRWLSASYGREHVEWAYTRVPPRVLVEEVLQTTDGQHPPEYKLFVIHGRVEVLYVDVDRFVDHRRNFYDRDWTPLDVSKDRYPRGEVGPRPGSLDRMVEIAERLGRETDFVRVDLYDVDGRVVFGELTNYPSAGYPNWSPPSYDLELGRRWTLPRKYR
jgi:hypothetical protein